MHDRFLDELFSIQSEATGFLSKQTVLSGDLNQVNSRRDPLDHQRFKLTTDPLAQLQLRNLFVADRCHDPLGGDLWAILVDSDRGGILQHNPPWLREQQFQGQ